MRLGIDPGPVTSGVVYYDERSKRVTESYKAFPNGELLGLAERASFFSSAAVECIEAIYSPCVGKETLETLRFIGRLEDRLRRACTLILLSPQKVRMLVTGTAAAKDPGVRQALIDKLGKPGTKADPGPTYGVTSHAWRALAVAYAMDQPGAWEHDLPHIVT